MWRLHGPKWLFGEWGGGDRTEAVRAQFSGSLCSLRELRDGERQIVLVSPSFAVRDTVEIFPLCNRWREDLDRSPRYVAPLECGSSFSRSNSTLLCIFFRVEVGRPTLQLHRPLCPRA